MEKETEKCCCSEKGNGDPGCCGDAMAQPGNDQEMSVDSSQVFPGSDLEDETPETGQKPVPGDASEGSSEGLKEAREEIGQLKAQLNLKDSQMEELLSRFQRLQADFENYRKRTQKEKEEMVLTAGSSVAEKILPVLDNFQRAINATGSEEGSFREGVGMIFKQLEKALADAGLQPIECVGTIFDPNLQQAVFRVEDDSLEENTVVEELQPGYLFGGKLVRPAMVKVSCKSGG